MSINKKVAKRIIKLRKQQDLTMENLAFISGIGKGTLSQIERGRSALKVETLYKITKGLEICLQEFFNDKDIFTE